MRRLSRRLVLPMGKSPRSAACVVCVLVLVVGLAAGESPGGTATVFHIQTATPSQQLAERYVSVTIDASNCQRGFAPLNEPSVSYKAQVLGKALSPAMLRIGGTSGDALTCACPVCGRVCVWPCVCVAVCVCVCVYCMCTVSCGCVWPCVCGHVCRRGWCECAYLPMTGAWRCRQHV